MRSLFAGGPVVSSQHQPAPPGAGSHRGTPWSRCPVAGVWTRAFPVRASRVISPGGRGPATRSLARRP